MAWVVGCGCTRPRCGTSAAMRSCIVPSNRQAGANTTRRPHRSRPCCRPAPHFTHGSATPISAAVPKVVACGMILVPRPAHSAAVLCQANSSSNCGKEFTASLDPPDPVLAAASSCTHPPHGSIDTMARKPRCCGEHNGNLLQAHSGSLSILLKSITKTR